MSFKEVKHYNGQVGVHVLIAMLQKVRIVEAPVVLADYYHETLQVDKFDLLQNVVHDAGPDSTDVFWVHYRRSPSSSLCFDPTMATEGDQYPKEVWTDPNESPPQKVTV